MSKRTLFGAIAALFAAMLALDAGMGIPTKYALFRELFDDKWQVARNISYGLASLGAAFFGYLALNIKNGEANGKKTQG